MEAPPHSADLRLVFLILAHEHPAIVAKLVQRVIALGDLAVVHWDRKNPIDLASEFRSRLRPEELENVAFAPRHAVDWGRWSMVEATLACLGTAAKSERRIDYAVLLSGADYPIRPIAELKAFLAADPTREYIECADPKRDQWVVGGLSSERYEYRHIVSWGTHPRLFDWLLDLQKRLMLKRKPPEGLLPHLGSQWWAITWRSALQALQLGQSRKISRFFRTVWVPDEMFFNTAIASTVPEERIAQTGVTFYHFSPSGRPLTFYNDHVSFVSKQHYFFARKLSPHADKLREALDGHLATKKTAPIKKIGKNLKEYDQFLAANWNGLANTRTIGKIKDAWYGDLEWNRYPYFAIVAAVNDAIEPLVAEISKNRRFQMFGELFNDGFIDYSSTDLELKSYPRAAVRLRDHKRPNFLCDVIQRWPDRRVGFVLRVPAKHEMLDIVAFDTNAFVVLCVPPSWRLVDAREHLRLTSPQRPWNDIAEVARKMTGAGKKPILWRVTGEGRGDDPASVVETLDRAIW